VPGPTRRRRPLPPTSRHHWDQRNPPERDTIATACRRSNSYKSAAAHRHRRCQPAAWWHNGRVPCLPSTGRTGSILGRAPLHNDTGQVLHTPVSPRRQSSPLYAQTSLLRFLAVELNLQLGFVCYGLQQVVRAPVGLILRSEILPIIKTEQDKTTDRSSGVSASYIASLRNSVPLCPCRFQT